MFAERSSHCLAHPNCRSQTESSTSGRAHTSTYAPSSTCQFCSSRRPFISPRHGLRGRNGERIGYGREGAVILDTPSLLRRGRGRAPVTVESLSDSVSGIDLVDAPTRRPMLPRGRPWPPHGIRENRPPGFMAPQSILSDGELEMDHEFGYGYGYPIQGHGHQHRSPFMTPTMSPRFPPRHPFLGSGVASPRSRRGASVGSGGGALIPRPRVPEGSGRMVNYRSPYVEDYESQMDAQDQLEYEAAMREMERRGDRGLWYDPDFYEEYPFEGEGRDEAW